MLVYWRVIGRDSNHRDFLEDFRLQPLLLWLAVQSLANHDVPYFLMPMLIPILGDSQIIPLAFDYYSISHVSIPWPIPIQFPPSFTRLVAVHATSCPASGCNGATCRVAFFSLATTCFQICRKPTTKRGVLEKKNLPKQFWDGWIKPSQYLPKFTLW